MSSGGASPFFLRMLGIFLVYGIILVLVAYLVGVQPIFYPIGFMVCYLIRRGKPPLNGFGPVITSLAWPITLVLCIAGTLIKAGQVKD